MKKLSIIIFIFNISDLSAGILNAGYSLDTALDNGQVLPPSSSVVMLEGGAPTGTLMHPMVVVTCAHSTHVPGEVVKFVNSEGEPVFSTYVKHAFVPAAYRQAIEERLKISNLKYMKELGDRLTEAVYAANLSHSFMQFGIERGLQLLKEEKGSAIYSDQESEADIQLLFLADVVPSEVAAPISLSLIIPQKKMPLHAISYGPIYGKQGPLRKMNLMDQDEGYFRHNYVSYMDETTGALIHTKFLDVPDFGNISHLHKLGSIVPGDSGSPVFIYNLLQNKWELQGLNVASCNGHAQYLPGVRGTICNLAPHLNWISEKINALLESTVQDEVGYVPQLVFDHTGIGEVNLLGQIKNTQDKVSLYANTEGHSYFELLKRGNMIAHATARLEGLESEDHMFVVDDHSPFKALSITSRDEEVLVVDWYVNRAPGSVHIRVSEKENLVADGTYGGTMAQIKLPYGHYDVSIQYSEKPHISKFAVSHLHPERLHLQKKWVSLKNIATQEKVYEGWVEDEKGLHVAGLDDGTYLMGAGRTSLPEYGVLVHVDHKKLSGGFVTIEQDRRHEAKIKLAWHGHHDGDSLRFEVFEQGSKKPLYQDNFDKGQAVLKMPWGHYEVAVSKGKENLKIPYHHYKHPILKEQIKAVIDDQNEALFVASSWGGCRACDLSLLPDGKYLILTKDKKKGVKKLHALVAHEKLPAEALVADLSGENIWKVNWFDSDIDKKRNFKFGYDGHMLDAKKSGASHVSFLKPTSSKFNVELTKRKSRKKERVEFVD